MTDSPDGSVYRERGAAHHSEPGDPFGPHPGRISNLHKWGRCRGVQMWRGSPVGAGLEDESEKYALPSMRHNAGMMQRTPDSLQHHLWKVYAGRRSSHLAHIPSPSWQSNPPSPLKGAFYPHQNFVVLQKFCNFYELASAHFLSRVLIYSRCCILQPWNMAQSCCLYTVKIKMKSTTLLSGIPWYQK